MHLKDQLELLEIMVVMVVAVEQGVVLHLVHGMSLEE
jgi:hypothetical protein